MIRSAPLTESYSKSLRSVGSFSLDTLRAPDAERGALDAADIAAIARNMTDPHSTGNERAVCASGVGCHKNLKNVKIFFIFIILFVFLTLLN